MKRLMFLMMLMLGFSTISYAQDEVIELEESIKFVKQEQEPRDRFMINLTFDNVFHKATNGFETNWASRGVGLYYMYDIPIKKSRISIAPGLGFSHASYYHNSFMTEDSAGISFTPIPDYKENDDFKKHKLAVNYLDIPVELRFFSKPSKKGNLFKAAIGFRASVRLTAVNKETNKDNDYFKKIKTKGYKDVSIFKGGPTLRIGYGGFNIIAFYSVTELFKKNLGPAMTPFSIGISITGL
jgi:hypothetical protein